MSREISKPPTNILEIQDLRIDIDSPTRHDGVLKGMNLSLPRGRTTALLGESGSGKTLTASAILGILPVDTRITSGKILFEQRDILSLSDRHMRHIRGNRIGMIHQEPSKSLNPLMTAGKQIGETLRIHKHLRKSDTKEQVISLMELVGIPDPMRCYHSFPHQLSGGVKQRVIIAAALACRPDLLLADEPTSALDATVQAQIVDLLVRLIRDLRMSVLLITHNLGVVAALADSIAVLLDGQIVETGTVKDVFADPAHPYTLSLLRPIARRHTAVSRWSYHQEGCPFVSQCGFAKALCATGPVEMISISAERQVKCILHQQEKVQ